MPCGPFWTLHPCPLLFLYHFKSRDVILFWSVAIFSFTFSLYVSFHIGVCEEWDRKGWCGQTNLKVWTYNGISKFFLAKILLHYHFLYNGESVFSIFFYNLLYTEHFHVPLNILQQHTSIHAAQTGLFLSACMSPARLWYLRLGWGFVHLFLYAQGLSQSRPQGIGIEWMNESMNVNFNSFNSMCAPQVRLIVQLLTGMFKHG